MGIVLVSLLETFNTLKENWLKVTYILQNSCIWRLFQTLMSLTIVCFSWPCLKLNEHEHACAQSNKDLYRSSHPKLFLTHSWRKSLSYRNQSIDLFCKSMDQFLYDTDLRHERVGTCVFMTQLNIFDKAFLLK